MKVFDDSKVDRNRNEAWGEEAALAEYVEVLYEWDLLGEDGKPSEPDGWAMTYTTIKAAEAKRVAWYKHAKLNRELRELQGLLQRAGSISVIAGSGRKVELGSEGAEWLQGKIESYLESSEAIACAYDSYAPQEAEYDNGEPMSKDAFFAFVREREQANLEAYEGKEGLQGKQGKGEWARLLGRYVDAFYNMGPQPVWAAGLSQTDQYNLIGELLKKAGVLAGVRDGLEQDWQAMNRNARWKAVDNWRDAFKRWQEGKNEQAGQ